MDISRASNFERFMFDIAGRDPDALAQLWRTLESEREFDIAATPMWARVGASGLVSGHSTHSGRIATIRDVHRRYGVVIDPHTADGVNVGRARRTAGMPLVCLETALPAKFSATIREALGFEPPRPAAFADLETRPQHCTVLAADAERVKAFVAANVHAGG
jgi:threonine synthase